MKTKRQNRRVYTETEVSVLGSPYAWVAGGHRNEGHFVTTRREVRVNTLTPKRRTV